ncbi:hypothetical protein Dsin_001145 [Dipteronia sinensis]|uniref:Uncharacterized protein n=1 Tax=Dipteronia sinensis TaxID=43782 RepID=A0AAE0B513_9ROSI|nr:hypothetical protein Dsin_001145 [Dipteronia sinensis]
MVQFREVMDDCDLVDLGFSGLRFTWNNKRDGKDNIHERLDRFMADSQWRDKFVNYRVENLGFNSSNHMPILLVCSTVTCYKQHLESFGNIQKQIGEKNREIERLYKLCGKSEVMNSNRILKKEVEGFLDCDEIYWKQRSRAGRF